MHIGTLSKTLLAALGWAWAAGAQTTATLWVTPNPAPAGQAFTLYLQGAGGDCSTTFARESVAVSGTRIDLRYTAQRLPVDPRTDTGIAIVCPVYGDIPELPLPVYGQPAFSMPALKAGKYEVWASEAPACLLQQPACKIAMPAPVSAGVLQVSEAIQPAYTFTPASAAAGQAFALHLLSYDFTCGTSYDGLSAVVADGAITLNFLDNAHPEAMCPAVYMPYGPVFQMPALKAGTYAVSVNRLSANAIVKAGTLQVTAGTVHEDWYLKERTVAPDRAFEMQLLKDSLPFCTSFSNQSVSVSGGRIYASFQMLTGKCAGISETPIGPVFPMQALKDGIYPVHPYQLLPCETADPVCVVDRVAPPATDTLVVAKGLVLRMSVLRAGGLKAELRGGAAVFALPAGGTVSGAGPWHAELLALDGRVLGEARVAGPAGSQASVPLRAARAGSVVLLRLTAADGMQRFLPIAR